MKQGFHFIQLETQTTLPIEAYIKEKEEKLEKQNKVGSKEIEI